MSNNKSEIAVFNSFRKTLSKYESSVIKLLGDNNISPEQFMVTVENAVRKTPALLKCVPESLYGSILTAAQFGLEPNTPAGLSWIIPYKKGNGANAPVYAEWQIGYQGIVNLLYRNQRIKKVVSEIVYVNDQFDRWMDDDMEWRFKFKPSPDGQRGVRRGVFAVIHVKDSEPLFTYLSTPEIEEIKAKSKSPQMYDPKNDPQGWMWKKAAVKQCAKLAPKGGPRVQDALNIDSMIEAGASVVLDQDGRVIVEKIKENRKVDQRKVNMIFGDVEETHVMED
jgi:recombination protein RecT